MRFLKDWWFWVYWIVLLYCVVDIVSNLDTLVRWKWGYWSIDMIPAVIVILLLSYFNIIIWNTRRDKQIEKIEKDIIKLVGK